MAKEVECTCTYCDHKFILTVWGYGNAEVVCPSCGDKKVKKKPIDKSDVFGYNYKERKQRDE